MRLLTEHIERVIAAAFVLAALTLFGFSVKTREQFADLDNTARQTQASGETLLALEAFYRAVLDAETGQRGYMLTGQDSYLAPYRQGVAAAWVQYEHLSEHVDRAPSQRERLARLKTFTTNKLAELGRTISLKQSGHGDEALDVVVHNEGFYLMEEIRRLTEAMIGHERAIAAARAEQARSAHESTEKLLLGAQLALGMGFIGAFIAVRRHLERERARNHALLESQAALTRSERRLRGLTDSLPVLVAHIGADEAYRFNNKHYERVFGIDRNALQGKTVASFYPPEIYVQIKPHIDRALRGEAVRFELQRDDRGPRHHFIIDYVPDFDERGQVDGIYTLVTDVTPMKEAQARLRDSEEQMRAILAHAPEAFIAIDDQGLIIEWNREAERTFGWQREEVMGMSLGEVLIPERLREEHAANVAQFAATGRAWTLNTRIERVVLRRDGQEIPVEVTIAGMKRDGRYIANAFMHDITERKQVQQRLVANEKRLRAIADNMPAMISYIDRERRVQFCNAAFRHGLDLDSAAIIGRPLDGLMPGDGHDERAQAIQSALRGEVGRFESTSTIHGEQRHLHTTCLPDVQEDGSIAGVYVMCTDISALRQAERRLIELARKDALTDLPNRLHFDEALHAAMDRSRRERRGMALLFLDLDAVKTVNETFGHAGGDELIKGFARRLQNTLGHGDTVARLAEDEFVVILEDVQDEHEPETVARNIMAAMVPAFEVLGRQWHATTSIGMAFYQGGPQTGAELLASADEALYRAKHRGRNKFCTAYA